ncbi:Cyclin-SDS, partial [Glycine soja]
DFAVGEASCNSSRASVAGKGNINSRNEFSTDSTRNRRFEKRNENEVEVSESSCVDSASFASERNRSLILKFKREDKNLNENDDVSEACTKSEITTVLKFKSGSETKNAKEDDDVWCAKSEITCSEEQFNSNSKSSGNGNGNIKVSSDSNANDFVSFSSGVRASSFHEEANRNKENTKNRASESEYSEVSRSLHVEENCADLIAQSMTKEDSDVYDVVADLACSEDLRFSYCNDDFVRFEDLDDEDSYQMLRKRERRQGYVLNYGDGYFSTTEFGDTVIEQRAQMVHWIIEQSCRRQLRQETLFLGVNLLDRFLSKGYFKAKRNLLIVGIACLTLATRIEENQQYNRVGQKNFYIGSNVYSRSEVVAMEWVVQEVLKFQCFLPTIYNFLWYYLKAANADAVVEKRVKYLAVLALSGHEQLCYWPSTVAAALVILACLEFNQISSHKVIGIHVRSKDENLYECIESLEWVLRFPG